MLPLLVGQLIVVNIVFNMALPMASKVLSIVTFGRFPRVNGSTSFRLTTHDREVARTQEVRQTRRYVADGVFALRESVHVFFAFEFHETFKFLLRAAFLAHALIAVAALL